MSVQFIVTWQNSYEVALHPYFPSGVAKIVNTYAVYQIQAQILPKRTLTIGNSQANQPLFWVQSGSTAFPRQLIISLCNQTSASGKIYGYIDIASFQFVGVPPLDLEVHTALDRGTFFQIVGYGEANTLKVRSTTTAMHALPFRVDFFLLDTQHQTIFMTSYDGKVAIFSIFPFQQLKMIHTNCRIDFAQLINNYLFTISISRKESRNGIQCTTTLRLWNLHNGTLFKERTFCLPNLQSVSPRNYFHLSPQRDRCLVVYNGWKNSDFITFSLPDCTQLNASNHWVNISESPGVGGNGFFSYADTTNTDSSDVTLRTLSLNHHTPHFSLRLGEQSTHTPPVTVFTYGSEILFCLKNTMYALDL